MEETCTLGELVDSPETLKNVYKAFTGDPDDGDETSNTTNPIESIDRQSFKSKNNLNIILANIDLENRTDAVKMVAGSRHDHKFSVIKKKKE